MWHGSLSIYSHRSHSLTQATRHKLQDTYSNVHKVDTNKQTNKHCRGCTVSASRLVASSDHPCLSHSLAHSLSVSLSLRGCTVSASRLVASSDHPRLSHSLARSLSLSLSGDILYLPAGWLHRVTTRGSTFTVNWGFFAQD